jgi:hypothetical protein
VVIGYRDVLMIVHRKGGHADTVKCIKISSLRRLCLRTLNKRIVSELSTFIC